MRVLLLVLQFPPDVNSNGRLLAQVGRGLVERGHDVTVVTSFPHYEHFRVWPEYRGKLVERTQYHGMDVFRFFVHASGNKRRMFDRFLSYFTFSLLATLFGLRSKREYDVILCPNGGFLIGIAAAILSQAKHIPLVLNLQDLYPETPIRTGQIVNRWVINVLRGLERYMYSKAAHITVITPYFRDYLLKMGIPPQGISCIPNFVDTESIRPLQRNNYFGRRHGLIDKFVVSHAGNLGYAYDLDSLVDAAALLRSDEDILFLLIGDGVLRERLQQKVRRLDLANVRFLPYQSDSDLPWLRAASDVQVALNRPGASAHSMPSKVYEIMASGRPLLASADRGSDLWNLVEHTGCGVVIEPRDARALAAAVLRLLHSPVERQAMGDRGRAEALARYSRASVVLRYDEILRRVAATDDAAGVKDTAPPRLAVAARDPI